MQNTKDSTSSLNTERLTLNAKSTLFPELHFLIACCQTNLSEEDISFIRSYLNAQHLTLHALIGLANQHGILPLIYKTIKKLSSSSSLNAKRLTLNAFLSKLKTQYMSISHRNMLMSAELIRIIQLLEKNSIEALSFKGPALSQMAYGDITLRQYMDLDILVDEQVVSKAGKLLAENGFDPILSMKILTNPICLELDKDFSFLSKSGQTHTEMHWRLVPKGLNTHFDFDQLIQEKQSISINGKMIDTLSSEHLLTYLCIHGSKHAWERIEWICDIDRLIRSHDIEWNKVLAYTKSKNDRRPLLLGLRLSQKFFQTPLPDTIIKIMTDESQINELTMEIIDFFNDASISNSDLQRIYLIEAFVAKVFHEKQNRTVTFLGKIFKVSRRDCQYFVLPKKLKFLYIFLRPFRLIYTRLNQSDK